MKSTVLTVKGAVPEFFKTDKEARAKIARRQVPFHRDGTKIIFIRHELESFFASLPGCTVEEAMTNLRTRKEANND